MAGPLALMGLVWLMFGRTRRKEAERFTRSVIAMRTEARSLQDVLGRAVAADRGESPHAGPDGRRPDGPWRPGRNPARRDHRRPQRRLADPGRTWRGARPGGRSGANRYRRAARRLAAGRGQRPANGRNAARGRPLGDRPGRQLRSARSTSLPTQAQQADAIVREASERLLAQPRPRSKAPALLPRPAYPRPELRDRRRGRRLACPIGRSADRNSRRDRRPGRGRVGAGRAEPGGHRPRRDRRFRAARRAAGQRRRRARRAYRPESPSRSAPRSG